MQPQYDHFLEEEGGEGPEEEEWPDHDAKEIIFFEGLIERVLQKLAILEPADHRLCEQEGGEEDDGQVEEPMEL